MAACRTYAPTKAPRRRHRNTGARRGSGLFTELFTAHHTVVTIASAPGCGHFGSPSSSTGPEGGGGARGEVLEWRKFSPVKTEVISITLKDTRTGIRVGKRRVAGLGGALSHAFYVTLVQTSPRRPPSVPHIPPRPSMRQRRPTRTPRRPDRFSRRDPGAPWRRKGAQDGQERRPEHRDELHLAGYPRRQGQCHGVFS